MASGLPIVSTEAGGIPEIVDKDVGMLVPPDDPERLSGALSRMIAGVHEYDRQMIARRADRFSRKSVGALIHSVYEECVRR
jgi:glycosyltransferase involved in cell wall biosynthesis